MLVQQLEKITARLLKPTPTPWGHSRWETLERCPREYSLRYNYGIYGTELNRPAAIGTAVHRGLAAYYSARILEQQSGPIGCRDEYALEVTGRGSEPEDVKLEAKRLVDAHNRFWADLDEGFVEVIAVEKPAAAVIKNTKFSCRYDLVVRDKSGDWQITDHKTKSRDGDATEFAMNGQFMGMIAAWPYRAKRPSEVTINRINRTSKPSFRHDVLTFGDTQIDRWKKDITLLDKDRLRYEKSNYWPRKRSSCVTKFGLCRFFNLCHAGPQFQDSFRVPKGTDLTEALK